MGAKFFLTIGVLVPAVLTIAGVSTLGLAQMAASTDVLYRHSFAISEHSADVVSAMYAIHETALYQVAVDDAALRSQLSAELDQELIPRAEAAITVLRDDYEHQPEEQGLVNHIRTGLDSYLQLRRASPDARGQGDVGSRRTALARQIDGVLEPAVETGQQLRAAEAERATGNKKHFDATYRSTRILLAASVLGVLLLGLSIVIGLIRNMVPRIQKYSQFAADFAAGRPTAALSPRGRDELAELGSALDHMVLQRQAAAAVETALRESTARTEYAQAEFVETLQVTQNEDEAQELLQRHLERSLPGSSVAVLRRNNSANRLQAATALPAGSQLAARLLSAQPRTCVAVRLGRTHREGNGQPPLLSCALCGNEQPATCEPLLVGGEVIGAILVSHPEVLSHSDDTQIKSTVGQAAPVLANLRSLALAEFRANNDSLTGLPNKRATEETLKRMVAQAGRSVAPLTAVMLDLDHFKQINDRFGHALGDEVLAAVGTAISASVRASDFAGRFGGEEFLVLLPDTTVDGAWGVAEKIRSSIAAITVPGVERAITASLGIAGLLEHAGNATGLLREADRAQYAAKAAGRNRTVVASDPIPPAVGASTGAVPLAEPGEQ